MKIGFLTLLLACLAGCASSSKLASCDGKSIRPVNKPQQSSAVSAASFANCT